MLDVLSTEPENEAFEGKIEFTRIDTTLTNQQYVEMCIKRARKFFLQECGNTEAKKSNLSDMQNTKVETPLIIREPISNYSELDPEISKAHVMVSGNIKAMIPVCREILIAEPLEDNKQSFKYRRGS